MKAVLVSAAARRSLYKLLECGLLEHWKGAQDW